MRPAVSIITPTRDRPEAFARAFRSMRAQVWRDWEWVVVDDASVSDYAAEATAEDPRVTLVRLRQNAGKGGARNAGLDAARGEWIGFLDDDDELLPTALAQLVSMAAEHAGAGAIYRGGILADRGTGTTRVAGGFYRSADPWIAALFDIGNVFPWIAPAAAVQRIRFKDHGFFQDADYYLRLAAELPIIRTRVSLGVYHLHGSSSSASAAGATDPAMVLTTGLDAVDSLFEVADPRIGSYAERGARDLVRAARYVWHASTFGQYPLRGAWCGALQASSSWRAVTWLLRGSYLRLEARVPLLRRARRRYSKEQ